MPFEVALAVGMGAAEAGAALGGLAGAAGAFGAAETVGLGALAEGAADSYLSEGAGSLAAGLTDGALSSVSAGTELTPQMLNGAVGDTLGDGASTTTLGTEAPASEISNTAKTLVGADTPTGAPAQALQDSAAGAGRSAGPGGPLISDSAGVDEFAAGANKKGLIDTAIDFANTNPRVASSLVQGAGSALGGAAKGAGQVLTEQRRLQNEKDLTAARLAIYQQFVQGGSAGGAGVNLGVRPTGVILKLPG